MTSTAITGTPVLVRAEIRHGGRSFAPWILIAAALSASSVLVYPWVFPTQADRMGLEAAIGGNPAIGLVFGPARNLATADGFTSWRALALGGLVAALCMIFAVTRSTRAQEDSGQAELVASNVVGRSARLLAGVLQGLGASVLLGLITATATVLCGGSANASFLLAATMTATGWMFTGVAAITAQLGADARAANTLAVGTLGVLFILRGTAYAVAAPEWTLWINPLGWMTETRPADTNTWWPLLLAIALTVVLLAVAFALQSRRDLGVGALPPRPGPARGSIHSTFHFTLRLNRVTLMSWTLAFLTLGFVFGYLTISMIDILSANPVVQQILAAGATTTATLHSTFVVTILSIVGILASIVGVQLMLKLRTEELDDRVAPLIVASGHRARYFAANVTIALVAPALLVILAGTIIAFIASASELSLDFGTTFAQALATVPATWAVISLAVAVVGVRPEVTLAAWVGVFVSFGLTILGPTFKLADGVLAISPFWHVPHVADADANSWGLVGVGLVTAVLVVAGFVGFRRRDIDG